MKIKIEHKFITLNEYINKERSNRFAAASVKKKETEVARKAFEGVIIPTPTKVVFTWHLPHRRFDIDNVGSAGAKMICDGMTKAGAIPNDNINHIVEITHKFVIDKDWRGVDMEFEEVKDE